MARKSTESWEAVRAQKPLNEARVATYRRLMEAEALLDPLDALVTQVIDCGSVTRRIVKQMVVSRSAGQSAPDAPPIPVVLHGLLRSVLEPLAAAYLEDELEGTTAMLADITQTISEEIFHVPGADDDVTTGERDWRPD